MPGQNIYEIIIRAAVEGERDIDDLSGGISRIGAAAESGALAAGALAAAMAGLVAAFVEVSSIMQDFFSSVIDTGAAFDELRSALTTLSGSSEQAEKDLEWIEQFTATTPYELMDVAEAFKTMAAYGLDASGDLQMLGDTASALGKSLDEAVEMWVDAMGGEFERLKEFGIRAEQTGDTVLLKFKQGGKDMVIEAEKTSESVGAAMREIFERYAGGMAENAGKWNQMISNLSDSWTSFERLVAEAGVLETAEGILRQFTEAIDELSQSGRLKEWAQEIGDVFTESFGGMDDYKDAIKGFLTTVKDVFLWMEEHTLPAIRTLADTTRDFMVLLGRDPDVTALDKTRDKIREVEEEMAAIEERVRNGEEGNIFQRMFYGGAEFAEGAREKLAELGNELETLKSKEQALTAEQDPAAKAAREAAEALDAQSRAADEAEMGLDGFDKVVQETTKSMKDMGDETKEVERQAKLTAEALNLLNVSPDVDFEPVIQGLEQLTGDTNVSADAFKQAFDNAVQMASSREEIQRLQEQVEGFADKGVDAGVAYADLNQRLGEIEAPDLSEIVEDTKDLVTYTEEWVNAFEEMSVAHSEFSQSVHDAHATFREDTAEDMERIRGVAEAIAAQFNNVMDGALEIGERAREYFTDTFSFAPDFSSLFWNLDQTRKRIEFMSDEYEEYRARFQYLIDQVAQGDEQASMQAEVLLDNMWMLDDVELGNLTAQLDDARMSLDSMRDSAEQTVGRLREELASMKGDMMEVERLRYEQRRQELEDLIEASSDEEMKRSYKESLQLLEQIHQEKIKKIKTEDDERSKRDEERSQRERSRDDETHKKRLDNLDEEQKKREDMQKFLDENYTPSDINATRNELTVNVYAQMDELKDKSFWEKVTLDYILPVIEDHNRRSR